MDKGICPIPLGASEGGATKLCGTCGERKPPDAFLPRKASPDGRRNQCRTCFSVVRDRYYQTHREEARDRRRWRRYCERCGGGFVGEGSFCKPCGNDERECATCGCRFRGVGTYCRECQTPDRECVTCGSAFRSKGGNLHCGPCRATSRNCTECGRLFAGAVSRCPSCQHRERICTECGKTFKGTTHRCQACSATDRECVSCGKAFKGNESRCSACTSIERECAQCGRIFRGHQRVCPRCQHVDRECTSCGCRFKGKARQCSSCRWLALPLEERIAQARRDSNARRARKVKAQILGPLPVEVYARIVSSGPCSYCGSDATVVDHIRPLADGGIEHETNLTPACMPCNSSKNSRLLIEWDPGRVAYGVAHCPKVAAEHKRQLRGVALF